MLQRRPHALLYLVAFVMCGVMVSFVGPAIPYIAEALGRRKGDFGLAFTLLSAGNFVGALTFGRLYERGGHGILGVAAAATALAIGALSQATAFGAVMAVSLVIGFAGGGVDLGGNVLMVRAVRDNLGPWMNALHLSFAVGGLLAPVLIYLSERTSSSLSVAAAVIGCLALLVIIGLRALPSPVPLPHDQEDGRTLPSMSTVIVVSLFFFFYVGLEVSCISWLASFVDDAGFGGDAAPAIITTVFFAAFAVGRLGAIVLLNRVRTWPLLIGSAALAVVASLLMWVGRDSYPAVAIAAILFGVGVAPQFATMITTSEAAFTLTPKVTSSFSAFGSAAIMTIPFLIGKRMNAVGPVALPQALTILAILTLGWTFVVRRLLTTARPSPERVAASA